ncbi:beta-propeller fold lactonase family protein [Calothrix sp. PCC 7507]|uniref:beta-propeller fold lactonase family protein n=1 Tax=Calothrix sp. PCC 7507 TaxID=99598 RepID=UPI00029F4955|nr:beta-propeller fold lactonase family protein [Calothrix sp. PCC 7507]AFY36089.1 FG-GAP repeat-containing protein [Calothrix sp. PCC 7507]
MTDNILNFIEFKKDGIDGVDGLAGSWSVTVSPDGKFLYAAGSKDSAVAVFKRNPDTGKLSFVEVQKDGVGGVDGLNYVTSVTVSPDGKFLYASGFGDSAVAVFKRNPDTGKLSFVEVQKNNVGGITGLFSVDYVTVSPDNKFLYTAAYNDSAVAVFQRNTDTGQLSFVEVKKNGIAGITGLGQVSSITVSPDNNFLYTTGLNDSAVAVFKRDATTGKLSFVEVKKDGVGGVDGLGGVFSATISPDGQYLYAAGYYDSAVAVFKRDKTTGKLSFVEVKKDGVGGVDGLGGAFSVTISPDGKYVYAAGRIDSAVAMFARDANTGKLSFLKVQKDGVGSVDGLADAYSVTLSPDGKYLYAAGRNDSAVAVFNTAPQNENNIAPTTLLAKLAIANTLSENETNTATLTKLDTEDIFTIKNNFEDSKAKLSVKIQSNTAQLVNQLSVFTVDDAQGTIDGIVPGAVGYTEKALQRSKVIFSPIANLPDGFNPTDLTSLLEFESGANLRFYLVRNSTTEEVLSGKTPLSDVLFLNEGVAEDDGFSLNFQDLVVKIQATNQALPLGTGLQGQQQGELIDLRGVTQSVTAEFIVNREAAYDNFVGFYAVADENGGIDTNGDGIADVLVGQAGYTEAAVSQRVAGIDLTVNNQGTATYTGTFEADSLFAPFIIANGRPDAILDSDPNNNPDVYFSFLGANTDQASHIRLLGSNTFGFEDLVNGGNQDYNDFIVRINLSVNNPTT